MTTACYLRWMTDTAIPPERAEPRGPRLRPRFLLRLDDTTYEVLRDFAHRHRQPMTAVVRDAIRAYLKDRL